MKKGFQVPLYYYYAFIYPGKLFENHFSFTNNNMLYTINVCKLNYIDFTVMKYEITGLSEMYN